MMLSRLNKKPLKNQWGYILRVTHETESIFTFLSDSIKNSFLPSISSFELDDIETRLI
jgi:hypothetical protein